MMDVGVLREKIEPIVGDVDRMCGETECEWCGMWSDVGCVWIALRETLEI